MICPKCNTDTVRRTRPQGWLVCSHCRYTWPVKFYQKMLAEVTAWGRVGFSMDFETWADHVRTSGQSNCSCGHPGGSPPCYWCTEGIYQDYENWCEENGQQPEYNGPINKYNSIGDTGMQLNRKNFAEFFRTDFYTVSVKFHGTDGNLQPKEYTYKVHKDVVIGIGDRVVVCVSNDPKLAYELKVVVVVGVNTEPELEGSDCINYKWIVGRYDEMIAPYLENIEKDTRLKRAVHTLERKLEKIHLRKAISEAMGELDDSDKAELKALFGAELQEPQKLGNGDSEAK